MSNDLSADYSVLDRPEVSGLLFHPRPEPAVASQRPDAASGDMSTVDILIPVAKDVTIGARFHMSHPSGGNILFFHGNGEIVADYDDLGPIYNRMGINFLAVDYRGYGRSSGTPTVSAMMQDCHRILDFVRGWLQEHNFNGPLILMGRSLGSASVLELAAAHGASINGLIVESGFADAAALLKLLGIDPEALGFKEEKGFGNIDKIRKFDKPTLIIHAEFDHIIPFSDGKALYKACPSSDKSFLKIAGANHNDIFMRGLNQYLSAIKKLAAASSKS